MIQLIVMPASHELMYSAFHVIGTRHKYNEMQRRYAVERTNQKKVIHINKTIPHVFRMVLSPRLFVSCDYPELTMFIYYNISSTRDTLHEVENKFLCGQHNFFPTHRFSRTDLLQYELILFRASVVYLNERKRKLSNETLLSTSPWYVNCSVSQSRQLKGFSILNVTCFITNYHHDKSFW